MPTFAKLVGTPVPADRVIDGRDITPLMFNPKARPVRDTHLYFDAGQRLAAIRQGEWKLFVGVDGRATQAISDQEDGKKKPGKNKKAAASKHGQHGLYNLADDPGEAKDVAAAHPDIVARLSAEAKVRGEEIQAHKRPAGQHEGAK